jgi:uncharacterized protein with FMN-binding domain
MNRSKAHQVVPSIIMAGAAAIPIVTTVQILTHVPAGAGGVALQPSRPIAALPSGTTAGSAGSSAPAGSGGVQTYQGPVVTDPFGNVQATIAVVGKKITSVRISAPLGNPRSAGINQQAVPLLQSETLQAQSAQINGVSGATITSQAYAQSLQAAIAQAQRQGNAPAATTASSQAGNSGSGSASQNPSVSVPGDD